jgi:hypothetical protein
MPTCASKNSPLSRYNSASHHRDERRGG